MTEEAQNNPGIIMTHGMEAQWVGEDSVKRKMEIIRLNDGDIGITLLSYWDGETSTPMTTRFRLKQETVSVMGECIFRFFNDLDRWKFPEE